MELILDPEQRQEIQSMVIKAVNDGIKQAKNTKPYLNRKEVAKYFGVAESTISYWATLGMPPEQNKKPLAIAVVKDKQRN
ncbi:helix-turn-helix domain containing protein [Lactobacillus gasseri]|nr:helix-turn-helix domain containing protein [Lactobacillus gasseri]MCZ3673021.1 helix-turn-helix domain containing protein [Lactobacillus gasseri]MCZ3677003.1 helix-turn-helix domain containing protein [Lactobacillus gasseri]MCZ3678395.1 helix-turn-helix domain containing protein [Lactobacillus gasseri]MCZ3680983.1 helix-turn-helix domain containing protein [Lactobacillus gasseri]